MSETLIDTQLGADASPVVDPAVVARDVLVRWAAHHEPAQDPAGWEVVAQEDVCVFMHPTRPRRYLVSGQCVAVCGSSPDAVLEATSWLR